MGQFIDISVHESIAERWRSVGWEGLTDAEREIGCVYLYHHHLMHGGLQTALNTLSRTELNAALGGLRRVGAPKAAGLLTSILEGAEPGVLKQVEQDFVGSELAAIRLTLPESYATAHPDEFPGPKSLLELWQSMQARGIVEKPARLIEMERRAESDARFTDRRCDTCGQPVPEYKSRCCRCGRPYRADGLVA